MNIGPYWIGDVPTQSPVIDVQREGEAPGLDLFDNVTFKLIDPTGATTATFDGEFTDEDVSFTWPLESLFVTAGVYEIRPVFSTLVGYRERSASLFFIVQDDDGWLTLDTSRSNWADAPDDDVQLHNLLTVARQQVTAYAPSLAVPSVVPVHYRSAQLMQARNIWNSSKVAPDSGGFGEGSFVIRPFPLDWMVKQMVRPASAVRRIG